MMHKFSIHAILGAIRRSIFPLTFIHKLMDSGEFSELPC